MMKRKLVSRNIGKILRKPYYSLWRLLERLVYQGKEYTLQVPFGHLVYTPWFASNSEFAEFISSVKQSGPLIVSLDRCYMIYQFCRYAIFATNGDVVECGTYKGGTAYLMASIIEKTNTHRNLHLFDTFAGMPDLAIQERDVHAPGDFGDVSLEYVQKRLSKFQFVKFHPGTMPDTFSEVAHLENFSFVHVDVDIYPTALECCKFFWPRLAQGGGSTF